MSSEDVISEAAFKDATRDAMALVRAQLEGDVETAAVILDHADAANVALVLADMAAGVLSGLHGSRACAAEVVAAAQRASVAAMEAEDGQ